MWHAYSLGIRIKIGSAKWCGSPALKGCSLCDMPRLRVHLTVPLLATSSLLTSPTLVHTGLPVSPPSLLTWKQHWNNLFGITMTPNQCCGSVIFIPDPGSWFFTFPDPGSRIPDPRSKNSNKREGWKKICCHTFFGGNKFHKIEYYFIFGMLKKNFGPIFK